MMIEGTKIKFTDEVIEQAGENVKQVMRAGRLVHDEFYPAFEQMLRDVTGQPEVALFCSDTAAQEILFGALGTLKIVFQGNAFPSPVFAAMRAQAKVCWVDIDPLTMDIDLDHLRKVIREGTVMPDAIDVMSNGGQIMHNALELKHLCHENDITVIDDAAHCFGAKRGEVVTGSWADYTVFSFYATKNMCMGEGGAIVGTDREIIHFCEQQSYYGKGSRFGPFICYSPGFSVRQTELLCAVGMAVYPGVAAAIHRRREIAKLYLELLGDTELYFYDYGGSSFFKMPVLMPKKFDHGLFFAWMKQQGISVPQGVYPVVTSHQPAFLGKYDDVHLPGCQEFVDRHFYMPNHEWLTDEDVHTIAQTIKQYLVEVF